MSEDDDVPLKFELAISKLQGSVDQGFSEVRGQLALLLQRADQQDKRADSHASELSNQETRLRDVENRYVSRADLESVDYKVDQLGRQAVTQEQQQAYRKHTLGWTALIVTIIGIIISAGVTLMVGVVL